MQFAYHGAVTAADEVHPDLPVHHVPGDGDVVALVLQVAVDLLRNRRRRRPLVPLVRPREAHDPARRRFLCRRDCEDAGGRRSRGRACERGGGCAKTAAHEGFSVDGEDQVARFEVCLRQKMGLDTGGTKVARTNRTIGCRAVFIRISRSRSAQMRPIQIGLSLIKLSDEWGRKVWLQ